MEATACQGSFVNCPGGDALNWGTPCSHADGSPLPICSANTSALAFVRSECIGKRSCSLDPVGGLGLDEHECIRDSYIARRSKHSDRLRFRVAVMCSGSGGGDNRCISKSVLALDKDNNAGENQEEKKKPYFDSRLYEPADYTGWTFLSKVV